MSTRKLALITGLGLLALSACDTTDNPAREAVTHIKALTVIIEDNAGDCAGTIREFESYLRENQQAMNEGIARSEQLDKKQNMVFEEIMMTELPPVAKGFTKSKNAFEASCKKKLPSFPYSALVGY